MARLNSRLGKDVGKSQGPTCHGFENNSSTSFQQQTSASQLSLQNVMSGAIYQINHTQLFHNEEEKHEEYFVKNLANSMKLFKLLHSRLL